MYKKILKIIAFSLVAFIVLSLTTWLIIKSVMLEAVEIVGASMEDTLFDGDVIYVNTKKEPKHGDIIIILGEKTDEEDSLIVKRFIAGDGDTVKIDDGKLYVRKKGETDFNEVSEEFSKSPLNDYDSDWLGEYPEGYTLKNDEIFYLGDNRGNSKDSRSMDFKTCTTDQILGVGTKFFLKTKAFTTWFYEFKDEIRVFFGLEPNLYKNK